MMYSNVDDMVAEYERRINNLTNQISELQNQVYQLQSLIKEKDNQINQLYNENQQMKAQIQSFQQQVSQSPYYGEQPAQVPAQQKAKQTPVGGQTANSIITSSNDTITLNKRECPKCGAFGFAIKEVEDKSRLLSYIPRRIYAKKHVCTKCFYEW
ncbi:MAG: cell division protein ZapB [Promethearchaeota archaeon]